MERFDRLTGIAAPLLQENINTDAIIPVPWIVNFGRDFGHGLLGNWRYDADEREKPDFILNQPPYREAKILLAGRRGSPRAGIALLERRRSAAGRGTLRVHHRRGRLRCRWSHGLASATTGQERHTKRKGWENVSQLHVVLLAA